MSMEHWLIKKHGSNIELTSMFYLDLRREILKHDKYCLAVANLYNSVFDWDKIIPHYKFFYDFENNDVVLPELFAKSKLATAEYLLVETSADLPIIKIRTNYFIENCMDFIDVNLGMGSTIVSSDYQFLIEFTDDRKFMLFSNFLVQQ